MENNKVALFTLCNDEMVDYCLTMLYSFLLNNEWFKECGEINVLCDKNISKISTENRIKFFNLYKKVIFREVDYNFYKPLIEHQENVLETPIYFKMVTYKYEIFKDYGYSKHVYFDADIIIQQNIKELFFNNVNFAACLDKNSFQYENDILFNKTANTDAYFNTGVMVVGKNLMSNDAYNKLFNFSINLTKDYNFKKKETWKGVLIDQDVLNEVLENISLIPYDLYNKYHMDIDNLNYKIPKIIHYYGDYKPWKKISSFSEMAAMIFFKYDYMRKNNFNFIN